MDQELSHILTEAQGAASAVQNRPQYESFRATYVGPNGRLTQQMKGMGKLPPEEKPQMGKRINEVKQGLQSLFDNIEHVLQEAELKAMLGPEVDPTLPVPGESKGGYHPLTLVRRKITDIFASLGFTVAEGSQVESDWYNFDALNTPADHPARDEHDTLYMPTDTIFTNVDKKGNEPYVLRTHTSPVQIRTMLNKCEELPLRIISPGRAFRRDTVDATHSANFHQVEGLFVDENVTVQDLKAVLDHFIHALFGKSVKTRLRPSFFPFTEPSFEMDIMLSSDFGKLGGKWLEVMGCGIVDPEVFKAANVDPDLWTGYAFGMGLERMAMILYGIDDIRLFYQNNLQFLKQFS